MAQSIELSSHPLTPRGAFSSNGCVCHLNLKLLSRQKPWLSWRLYVTNALTTKLTLPQAVMYYRDEWLLERGFHRFKRGSLPALPIYFQNEDRITGLMFVLNIALRVFTVMEFVVRQALIETQQSLAGLYDGNPKRKTERPSAERMLQAFCHLTLYLLPNSTIFITPINALQKQILALMNMPESLYQSSKVQYAT